MKIIALDLETSGLVVGTHVPLSIGAVAIDLDDIAANGETRLLESEAFYVQLEWDSCNIAPEALRVNGLDIVNPPGCTMDDTHHSLPAQDGLQAFAAWLAAQGEVPLYAMGMNVGSFDLPMLKSVFVGDWPFHYRSVDLNSIFFALAMHDNVAYDDMKANIADRAWDDLRVCHPNCNEHHALWDAWFNAYAFMRCIGRIGG